MSFYFPRPELAAELYQRLLGNALLGAPAGLFLSGPRRTGKSSFLRLDFTPHAEAEGAHVIYADLWSNRDADPGQLIAEKIAANLKAVAKPGFIESLPFDSITLGPVAIDMRDQKGSTAGTLSEVLLQIADCVQKDVILIIDEAQDMLNTEAGRDVTFALKAARDAANQREDAPGLFLVFTGSNRDKLSELVTHKKQAFYGGSVTEFPPLGRAYIDAIAAEVNGGLAQDRQLSADDLEAAFIIVNHRPELLVRIIQEHMPLGAHTGADLAMTVVERADQLKALVWDELQAQFEGLSGPQQTVLRQMAQGAALFSPYKEAVLAAAAEMNAKPFATEDDQKAARSLQQKAIGALRDESIIWQRARGLYAFEDREMRDWLTHQFAEDEPERSA